MQLDKETSATCWGLLAIIEGVRKLMPEFERASIEYSGVNDALYNQKLRPYLEAFDAALMDITDGLIFLMQDSETASVRDAAQSAAEKIEITGERLENAALCDFAADAVEAFLIEVGIISAIRPINQGEQK